MRSRLLRIIAAAAVGLAAPYVELWVKCRRPVSEACVWAKAYLPLTRPAYFAAFGLLAFGALSLLARLHPRGVGMTARPPDNATCGRLCVALDFVS
jgi:hypothetical protein